MSWWWWLTYDYLHPTLVFVGIFFIACVYYKRTLPMDLEDFYPPTVKALPVIGSLPFLPHPHRIHFWFLNKLPTMGDVIGFYAMSRYSVVIQSREALNEAYVKHSHEFSSRPKMYIFRRLNPGSRGLIDKPFDESYRRYHRLTISILNTFGFGNHSVMETRINREVEDLVAEFRGQRSELVCPKMAVHGSVANVIASVLFGRRFERNDPLFQNLLKNIDSFTIHLMNTMPANVFPVVRFLLPGMRNDINDLVRLHDWLLDFLRQQIKANVTSGDEASFIASFLKVDGDLEELLFVVRDLMVAGTETSATSVLWAIALLADHRDVQARLHREIDAVIGGGSGNLETKHSGFRLGRRLPSLVDQTRMPFAEATILEVLRFKTITPMGLLRETTEEVCLDGQEIPARTLVMPNLYAIHMDPTVWKDPNVFRPDRFLDDDGNVILKDMVIPFSIGKRSCLGESLARQEIFLFIVGLLQSFEILPPEGQDFLNCTEVPGLAVAPSPFKVRFVPRKKVAPVTGGDL